MAPIRKIKLAATLSLVAGIVAPALIIPIASFEPWQSSVLSYLSVLLVLVGLCTLVSANRKDHQ